MSKKRPDWFDRRLMVYAMLGFSAGIVAYAVIFYPLAPDTSLVARTVDALVTASITAILGYTVAASTKNAKWMNGNKDEEPKP